MRLEPCGGCGTHVRVGDACPHCGSTSPRAPQPRVSAVVGLLGLAALSGCPIFGGEAEYGAVITLTGETAETEDTGATEP